MTTGRQAGIVLILGMMLMTAIAAWSKVQSQPSADGRDAPSVFDGVLSSVAGRPAMSTAELRAALTESSVIVLDARPYEEYAVSHIPGARAVPAKPGTTPALYVADAAEIAKTIPDKSQPLILYCNGLFCGRSERFADDLSKLEYQNVRKYQLGSPTICRNMRHTRRRAKTSADRDAASGRHGHATGGVRRSGLKRVPQEPSLLVPGYLGKWRSPGRKSAHGGNGE